MKRTPSNPKPGSRTEAMLATFKSIDPKKLDSDQRKFRSLGIQILKIELKLKAKGLVGKDGSIEPFPVRAGKRSPPPAAPGTPHTPGRGRRS